MAKGIKGFQPGNKIGIKSRFSTTKQPQKRGRKPSMYKKALKNSDTELSKEDFIFVIRSILEMDINSLMLIINESEKPESGIPVWIVVYIKALLSDIKRGKADLLKYSLELMFGKPTNEINVATKIQNEYNFHFDIKLFNTDELLIIDELFRKVKERTKNMIY